MKAQIKKAAFPETANQNDQSHSTSNQAQEPITQTYQLGEHFRIVITQKPNDRNIYVVWTPRIATPKELDELVGGSYDKAIKHFIATVSMKFMEVKS
jgi:hypothetical protein